MGTGAGTIPVIPGSARRLAVKIRRTRPPQTALVHGTWNSVRGFFTVRRPSGFNRIDGLIDAVSFDYVFSFFAEDIRRVLNIMALNTRRFNGKKVWP